jgi:hypothetical protein
VDALPVLADLRSLHLAMPVTDVDLTPLMQLPRLSHFHLPRMLGLLHLPALTALEPDMLAPECWADLNGCPQLRSLTVCWLLSFTAEDRTALENSLSALPRLAHLRLHLPDSNELAGVPLNLRQPALRSLSLRGLCLPSLGFLQHSPLLESMCLINCGMSSADVALENLGAYAPQLRSLELDSVGHLCNEQVSALRPPSALLPALSHFVYR